MQITFNKFLKIFSLFLFFFCRRETKDVAAWRCLGGQLLLTFYIAGDVVARGNFKRGRGEGRAGFETDGMQQMKRRSSFIKWQMGWERNVGWLTAPTVSSSSESGSKTDKE